jgi:Ca2+-binding EF-hand superfamily protein
VQNFSARQSKAYDIDPHYPPTVAMSHTGALPSYSTPRGGVTHISSQFPFSLMQPHNDIATPLGTKMQSPYGKFEDPLQSTLRNGMASMDFGSTLPYGNSRGQAAASSGAYERILRLIIERVKLSVEERMRTWGPNYSLREHFEYFDSQRDGSVSTRLFQQVLHEVGVELTPSDLQTLFGLYGTPEDNNIHYDGFMRAYESNTSTAYPPGLPAHMQNNSLRKSASQPLPPPPLSLTLSNNRSSSIAPYLHPRTLQRLRDLKADGNDPREYFAAHDADRSGMIPQTRFAAVIAKLQLLQTDHQLSRAIDDFSSISNR